MYLAMVILTLSLIVGCSTVKPTFITPSGGPVADHYYTLSSTEYPINTIFYYALGVVDKDVDGSIVPDLEYLKMFGTQTIVRKDYVGLYLSLYVDNPNELVYTAYKVIKKKVGLSYDPLEVSIGGPIGTSNKISRQFILHLPFEENVSDVEYTILLKVDGHEALQIGPFTYRLI